MTHEQSKESQGARRRYEEHFARLSPEAQEQENCSLFALLVHLIAKGEAQTVDGTQASQAPRLPASGAAHEEN